MSETRKYTGLPPNFPQGHSLVLVGMMGVGKTTVGRRLAPYVGLPFVDVDAEIEKASGMLAGELFTAHGEKSFREGEARIMKRLLEGAPQVISTGGGAVINPDTRALIRQHAVSIWIQADADTIVERATKRNTRPLLAQGDPKVTIANLLRERHDFYAEADIHVESQPGPHAHTVHLIVDRLDAYVPKPKQDE